MAGAKLVARFGASVRDLRCQLGISQEELAHRADLHRTYIAGVEGGARNLTLKSIGKLASALGVSIPDLLGSAEHGSRRSPANGNKAVEILLVEDSPDDVALTLAAFKEAGIANDVTVATDGEEALELLFPSRQKDIRTPKYPEVILLDLNPPKISGLEVLRRIKQDPHTESIPVIVLTVSQNSRDIETSRRLGAATYIVKPVDFQSFSRVTPELSLQWTLVKTRPLPKP